MNPADSPFDGLRFFVAPLQGYTDCVFRQAHAEVYGGDGPRPVYVTPFVRIEKGEPRQRDMRDVLADCNDPTADVVPQIIFRDADEFRRLVEALAGAGANRINLNMGCPYPMQVAKGRGAALLAGRGRLEEVASAMSEFPDITFSLKMRAGVSDSAQWRGTTDIIREMPLEWIAFHPRIASQLYNGVADHSITAEFIEAVRHPVVINGDINDPTSALEAFDIAGTGGRPMGIMCGRGLLGRPSLFCELGAGREWSPDERKKRLNDLHDRMFEAYSRRLCGDNQILMKVRTFWDYFNDPDIELPRKIRKAISKASSLTRYNEAVGQYWR